MYNNQLDKAQPEKDLDIMPSLDYISQQADKIPNREINVIFILNSLDFFGENEKKAMLEIQRKLQINFKYGCFQLLVLSDDYDEDCNLKFLDIGTKRGEFMVINEELS